MKQVRATTKDITSTVPSPINTAETISNALAGSHELKPSFHTKTYSSICTTALDKTCAAGTADFTAFVSCSTDTACGVDRRMYLYWVVLACRSRRVTTHGHEKLTHKINVSAISHETGNTCVPYAILSSVAMNPLAQAHS